MVLHFFPERVENGCVRPTERATGSRRSSAASNSARRGRRRTLFSSSARTTVALPPAVPTFRSAAPAEALAEPTSEEPTAEFAIEEFVIDDDEYPEVTIDRRRSMPTAAAEPDRVDDIDQWLEEFAVEDCCCDSLPG